MGEIVGAMLPPEGEEAHFGGGYTSLQMALIIVNVTTYAIATLALGLRIYTSACINKRTDVGDCAYPRLFCRVSMLTRFVQCSSSHPGA